MKVRRNFGNYLVEINKFQMSNESLTVTAFNENRCKRALRLLTILRDLRSVRKSVNIGRFFHNKGERERERQRERETERE